MIASTAAFVVACAWPYARWWAHPSLFDDDFLRVGSLRRSDLSEALFRPFNEHMAPLFEVVSWLAWVGSGRSILTIALGFQVASYAATATTAALLAAWIRREVRSTTAGLAAVDLFLLSSVAAETVLWYSASSFQWSASATLAACLAASIAAGSATRRGRLGWATGSAVAALAAPAFSAIGVLAGPLAALRIASAVEPGARLGRHLAWSIVPPCGTAAYLLICERFQYRALVSASVRQGFDPAAALWATVVAPAAVLVPGLVGLPEQSGRVDLSLLAGVTVAGLVGCLAWASRSRDRPLILVGLAMIFGGYLSTFATRARPGDPWVFEIQRYHLFPQIGLIALIAAAGSAGFRRLDRGRARGRLASAALAVLLLILQSSGMRRASDRAFRYPDQPRALVAATHLERACERRGVTLDQAVRAFEPARPPGFPRPWPFNPLLHLLPKGPDRSRIPDDLVRSILADDLSADDREAVFGGMEASRYLAPFDRPAGLAVVEARPVNPPRPGRSRDVVQEFAVDPAADPAGSLVLQGFQGVGGVELWWSGEAGEWTPARSFRWKPSDEPRAIGLAFLPHWRRGEVRRVRVIGRGTRPPGSIRFAR